MGVPLGAVVGGGVMGIAVCLVAAVAGIFIQSFCTQINSPPYCVCSDPASSSQEDRCLSIQNFVKVPLIAVHLIPFILMPISMWVCQSNGSTLMRMGAKSPVQVVWGLAYIMVSISGEVGWHVHQYWFYHEDFDILNCFFYVFNTLGATFWALGVQTEATQSGFLDGLLVLCTPLTTLVYGFGAYATSKDIEGPFKVPIYIIMSYQYGVLSWRLFKLLKEDHKVWLFPFFSIGANLTFVYFLQKNQANTILNPLFHILHDAAGTEMGVLIITLLLWSHCTTFKMETKKL